MPKIKSLTREHFKWTNGRGHDQKPILYSMKNNLHGLGLSPHIAQTDNWWERAFDNSLKSLSVTQSTQTGEITVVQEEVKGGGVGLKDVIARGMKGRGKAGLVLYGGGIKFVKGGWLEGGIEMKVRKEDVQSSAGSSTLSTSGESIHPHEEEIKKAVSKRESKSERKARRRAEKEAKAERRRLRRERKERKEKKRLVRMKEKEKGKGKAKAASIKGNIMATTEDTTEEKRVITPPTPPSSEEESQDRNERKTREKKS